MRTTGSYPTPWTGSFRRGSISPTLRGPYWWTGGTRWEGWEWIGWDTWGGGATRCPEWRSPLPNAILQASRGEKGGESQVGGAWGRLEDGGSQHSFYFQTRTSRFQSICELWIGGLAPCTSFQPSWRGRDDLNESESFVALSGFAC